MAQSPYIFVFVLIVYKEGTKFYNANYLVPIKKA